MDKIIIKNAIAESFYKLLPWIQIKNFVMFIVYLGAIISSVFLLKEYSSFNLQIVIWLWFTVIFANFAEAVAEGRGKAQADALKKMRTKSLARKQTSEGSFIEVNSATLSVGDIVECVAGEIIPADGEIIHGIASIDESAITGESAPVIRESGGDRSAVTGGTKVLSDRILIKVTSEQGNSFLDKMISMVEGANRKKTPNEIALEILLISLTIVFILVVFTLVFFTRYSEQAAGQSGIVNLNIVVLLSLLVCLIPTTIGGLLSAIGISGIDRLIRRNVMAMSGRAVEASGDIDVLLLDKTGTITFGNRMASEFYPAPNISPEYFATIAQLSSLADETPEGRSIVILAKNKFAFKNFDTTELNANFVSFSAETRMSGLDYIDKEKNKNQIIRKGASDSILKHIESLGGHFPLQVKNQVEEISKRGSTPLVVSENENVLGVIELKDIVKGGMKERFAQLRKMGIRTIMITGDNHLTAASIAAEAGVDDFMAQATPEDKLARIRSEQAQGKLVAMTGDGTNDAPALAQADVGVAMNTGTQAAREAGNMVDLDSDPTKLIEIVEIGKQLLMTRGALTTFSIANDVAKYFAILPAIFLSLYASDNRPGPLASLNIMQLHSPESAILSAVIFNALIIIALIPLALRGVSYVAEGASVVLKRNLIIYGLGGIIVPFIGIKLIDLILVSINLV
ncbi:MAG: potassium-transporting ATPase subunit KdpB [Proteobacteria bacterium]|nr:potassium-transporting ATPase subunit KdpB [Pseudomonadota bacterium]